MILVLLCVVVIMLCVAIYFCFKFSKINDLLVEERRKWELEYWLLRGSDAINHDYEIHLSWIPRGKYNCITKKAIVKGGLTYE